MSFVFPFFVVYVVRIAILCCLYCHSFVLPFLSFVTIRIAVFYHLCHSYCRFLIFISSIVTRVLTELRGGCMTGGMTSRGRGVSGTLRYKVLVGNVWLISVINISLLLRPFYCPLYWTCRNWKRFGILKFSKMLADNMTSVLR